MKARKIATAPGRGLKALGSMVFGRSSGMIWRFLPRTRFDYAREVGDGMGSSLIMAPILWMARTFPEAPIQVLDSDDQPIEPHEMVKLLRRPNPFYSGLVMWSALLLSWVVDGNAYLVKVRYKNTGGVGQLWYVPHWLIEPKSGDPNTFIEYYEYSVGGQKIQLDVEDVVHLRYGLDPHNPRKGMSPLASVLREVFSDDEAANFAAALLRNVGVPGLIVAPEKGSLPPNEEDVKATKGYIKDNFTGDKRGEPLVMSGATTVTQFGFSPEQMTVRDLRRVPEERVTAALGLPAIVVGFGAGLERSTFANFAEAREAAYESNMVPTWRLFAEELRNQLLPDFEQNADSLEVSFDLKQVRALQEDRNEEATRFGSLYKDGVIKRSEARIGVGEEATDADEVYAVPLAVMLVPADELPTPTEPTTEPAAEDPAEPADDADEAAAAEEAAKARGFKSRADQLQRYSLALRRDQIQLSTAFAQEIEHDLDSLGQKAAAEYERLAPDLASRGGTAKLDAHALVERILTNLGIAQFLDVNLRSRYSRHYRRTAARTVETVNAIFALNLELAPHVADTLADKGIERVSQLNLEGEARKAILDAIEQGRVNGVGVRETAREIRSWVPSGVFREAGPKYRAELIARTETLQAQRVAALAVYKDSPVVVQVQALDGRDGDSDEECQARDGEIFDIDAAEAEDEHPNGTLAWAPVTG